MTEEQKEAIRESLNRPEVKLKRLIASKNHYSDPDNRAKLSERMKKAFQEHPEYGKNRSEKLKKYYSNPENRLKCKERANKRKDDPEYKKKLSESLKRSWLNKTEEEREAIRQKRANSNKKAEVRSKISVSVKRRRIETLEEILSKNRSPKRRARENRIRMKKFYEERDKYYNLTKKMDNARTYGLITEAEAFIRFFSKRT